jgi:hypothetical protein
MSNSVHLSDMSRVPDQRCFRPFRNRQSAARSVLPNWQLPLTSFSEVPCPSASPDTNAPALWETGAPAAAFAYLARRACSMKARRTAFMRVW